MPTTAPSRAPRDRGRAGSAPAAVGRRVAAGSAASSSSRATSSTKSRVSPRDPATARSGCWRTSRRHAAAVRGRGARSVDGPAPSSDRPSTVRPKNPLRIMSGFDQRHGLRHEVSRGDARVEPMAEDTRRAPRHLALHRTAGTQAARRSPVPRPACRAPTPTPTTARTGRAAPRRGWSRRTRESAGRWACRIRRSCLALPAGTGATPSADAESTAGISRTRGSRHGTAITLVPDGDPGPARQREVLDALRGAPAVAPTSRSRRPSSGRFATNRARRERAAARHSRDRTPEGGRDGADRGVGPARRRRRCPTGPPYRGRLARRRVARRAGARPASAGRSSQPWPRSPAWRTVAPARRRRRGPASAPTAR